MSKLIVTSSVPGRRRAGHAFEGAKPFKLDHFSAEQLKAIIADPYLTVVAGDVLEADDVDAFLEATALEQSEADKGKPRGRGAKALEG